MIAAFVIPVDVQTVAEETMPSAWIQPASASEAPGGLTEEQFQSVWAKPLQKAVPVAAAVVEKPKPKAQPASAARVQMNAKLVGTLVDEGFSCAWVEAGGKRQMVSIGQIIDLHSGSPKVEKIEDRCVHVSIGGELHRIEMPTSALLASTSSGQGKAPSGSQGR